MAARAEEAASNDSGSIVKPAHSLLQGFSDPPSHGKTSRLCTFLNQSSRCAARHWALRRWRRDFRKIAEVHARIPQCRMLENFQQFIVARVSAQMDAPLRQF